MSRLEIIHLRLSGESVESINDRITASIQTAGKDTGILTLYRRDGLNTDIAVHLYMMMPPGKQGPSDLGCHIAAALRNYGLVEHTLWEEMTRTQI